MKMRLFVAAVLACGLLGCDDNNSDQRQQAQQESILAEGTSAVGMPAIKNFRERRLVKEILEMRDQENLITYTYLQSEMTGKLVYLGQTIGYGVPYSTQFTSPEKITYQGGAYHTMPQADPNGLFSPDSAEGTWITMVNPNNPKETKVVYIEPRVIVSPFPLNIQ